MWSSSAGLDQKARAVNEAARVSGPAGPEAPPCSKRYAPTSPAATAATNIIIVSCRYKATESRTV